MPSYLTRPKEDASPLVAFLASTSLPGDVSSLAAQRGAAEIWTRMGRIVRERSTFVEGQMGGFDARRTVYDLAQFRRALGNVFDTQWHALAMTSDEFHRVAAPYLTRRPVQAGEPGALVHWRDFARDLQHFASSESADGTWAREHTASHVERVDKVGRREAASARLLDEHGVTETELTLAFAYFKVLSASV